MKKKNTIIMALVTVAVLIGVYFVVTNMEVKEYFEDEWKTVGEYDLTGEWRITPYAITETGERIPIKSETQTLWIKHQNQIITKVQYVISARASSSDQMGAFDSVKVDATGLMMALGTGFQGETTFPLVPLSARFTKTNFGVKTMPFLAGPWPDGIRYTAWTEIASYTIPTDTTHRQMAQGDDWSQPFSFSADNLAEMTHEWQDGFWRFYYHNEGTITFQGLNSDVGDGKVLTANLPGSVNHFVLKGSYDVEMDFKTEVTYI